MLDAHPAVACPPELNLCTVFQSIEFAMHSAIGEDSALASESAAALCREVALSTIGRYATRAGKSLWCEKSLPSIEMTDVLRRVFPEARFVCLYRECTDTIASLLEASPWGYSNYGVEPYVRAFPGNLVLALATYWTDKVEHALALERECPDQCFRLRYEDLVAQPEAVLSELFESFLGLEWKASCADPSRVLANVRLGAFGDHKVRYTDSFHTESVGRGWRVPVNLMPDPLKARVTAMAEELGYRLLGDLSQVATPFGRRPPSDIAAEVARLIESRVSPRVNSLNGNRSCCFDRMNVLIADTGLQWLIDFASGSLTPGPGDAPCSIVTDSETLLAVASGSCNPGVAVRQSRIRIDADGETEPLEVIRGLEEFVSLIRA
jgi:hypothetical protein